MKSKRFKWKLPVLLVFLFSVASCFNDISCISVHLGGGGCLGEDSTKPYRLPPIVRSLDTQNAASGIVRALH